MRQPQQIHSQKPPLQRPRIQLSQLRAKLQLPLRTVADAAEDE